MTSRPEGNGGAFGIGTCTDVGAGPIGTGVETRGATGDSAAIPGVEAREPGLRDGATTAPAGRWLLGGG